MSAYALVFVSAFLLDVVYVRYMLHVRDDEPWKASLASMGIGLCGAVGLTGVVHDSWAVIPYLLGLGGGTLAGMHK